jgi:hypothetical protein
MTVLTTYIDHYGQQTWSSMSPPSLEALLELDIDTRLVEVWLHVWDRDESLVCEIGDLLRLAYGRGYCDALTEPSEGQLCRDHGFAVPDRRQLERE